MLLNLLIFKESVILEMDTSQSFMFKTLKHKFYQTYIEVRNFTLS